MAINRTLTNVRTSTSEDFLSNLNSLTDSTSTTDSSLLNGSYAPVYPFFTSGNTVCSISYSEDGLTQTITHEFDTIETFSAFENLTTGNLTFANDIRLWRFKHNNPPFGKLVNGITQPFAYTCVYTFPTLPPEEYSPTAIQAVFPSALQSATPGAAHRKDIVLEPDCVTIIHEYANSDDFNSDPWSDAFYQEQLISANCKKTISITLL